MRRRLLALCLVAASCGRPEIESRAEGGAGGAPSQGTGGTGGAISRTDASIPNFKPPGTGLDGGTTGPINGGEGNNTCTSSVGKAMPVPVDIYIMQDKSGSMRMPAQVGGAVTKWDATLKAVTAFLSSPANAGVNVGLGIFPIFSDECNPTTYATPVVPMAPLPGAAAAINDRLAMTSVSGDTPTLPALDGAVQVARAWSTTSNRRVAIAFATDGEPNGCGSTSANASAVAAQAAAMGIYTFVIGVGPSLQNLNAIAAAGGTKTAFQVESGSVDDLVAAFQSVQKQAARLACGFTVPPPPSGGMLDPDKVNVRFVPAGDPNKASVISRVDDKSKCNTSGGWYYDDPAAPTTISLCEQTCGEINASPNGEVSLLFGCKTKVIQ